MDPGWRRSQLRSAHLRAARQLDLPLSLTLDARKPGARHPDRHGSVLRVSAPWSRPEGTGSIGSPVRHDCLYERSTRPQKLEFHPLAAATPPFLSRYEALRIAVLPELHRALPVRDQKDLYTPAKRLSLPDVGHRLRISKPPRPVLLLPDHGCRSRTHHGRGRFLGCW